MKNTYCKHCGEKLEDPNLKSCPFCNGNLRSNSSDKISSVSSWLSQTKIKIIESSRPKIEKARSNVLDGLDKLIESIKDPNNLNFGGKKISPKYREKLAQSLASLKEKIQSPDKSGSEVEDYSTVDSQAEELISDELLNQLKNDRCIVCYAGFKNQTNIKVLICPQCGQGGHFDHLKQYIDSNNGLCPVCRKISQISKWFNFTL